MSPAPASQGSRAERRIRTYAARYACGFWSRGDYFAAEQVPERCHHCGCERVAGHTMHTDKDDDPREFARLQAARAAHHAAASAADTSGQAERRQGETLADAFARMWSNEPGPLSGDRRAAIAAARSPKEGA